ncbi:hypothetical protein [Butyricimonas faecihominis]|uniref:hypothetical protein n=1 Tax=Butyricimonas faecihominis TaxID=1472416 RepID=UPI0029394681|nr:hypothetical protein [Butyricimonas faecihominis]
MVEFSGVIYAIGVVYHSICQFGICYPDNHDFYRDGYGWGMDVDVSADTATDGDSGPFQLFTFRNFINFLLGFGWSIISFEKAIENQFVLILVSAVIGVLLVMAVMAIFRFMSRMEQSGTINMANAVGCKGNVYLKIPGEKRGEGKVQISIQGAIREFNALTAGEELETGAPIRVVEVINDNTLLVERF